MEPRSFERGKGRIFNGWFDALVLQWSRVRLNAESRASGVGRRQRRRFNGAAFV